MSHEQALMANVPDTAQAGSGVAVRETTTAEQMGPGLVGSSLGTEGTARRT